MHSNNYATKYEQNMRKRIVEFLSKFQGHDIKIRRVNSIRAAKPFIFFNISCAIPHKLTSPCATVFIEFNLRILSFANTYILVYAPARWRFTQYCRTYLSLFLRNGLGNTLFDHAGWEGLRSGLWETVFWCGTEGLPYNLEDTVFDDAGLGVYRTI